MPGLAVVHFALTLFASGVQPAAWTPSAELVIPTMTCSLSQVSDRVPASPDGAPQTEDARDGRHFCAPGSSPGIAAPDKTIFTTPVLQDHDDLEEDTVTPVRQIHRAHAPGVPLV